MVQYRKRGETMRKLTPMRAIRAKCLDCSGGSFLEVTNCPVSTCPLYPYKSGHKPRKGTEEYNFIAEPSLLEKQARRPMFGRKESML